MTSKSNAGAIVYQPYDFVAVFVLASFGLDERKDEAAVLYTVSLPPPFFGVQHTRVSSSKPFFLRR
jgi:hypothetical protein